MRTHQCKGASLRPPWLKAPVPALVYGYPYGRVGMQDRTSDDQTWFAMMGKCFLTKCLLNEAYCFKGFLSNATCPTLYGASNMCNSQVGLKENIRGRLEGVGIWWEVVTIIRNRFRSSEPMWSMRTHPYKEGAFGRLHQGGAACGRTLFVDVLVDGQALDTWFPMIRNDLWWLQCFPTKCIPLQATPWTFWGVHVDLDSFILLRTGCVNMCSDVSYAI